MEKLCDNNTTDKNTVHSYLPVYEHLLTPIQSSVKRVLEVGVERGGSMKMWAEFFPQAEVWGFDIQDKVPEFLKGHPRVKLFKTNAYDKRVVGDLIQKGLYFDVLIDDGPHTLESMIFFAKYYSQLLAPGGVLVIEDIPDPDWIQAIYGCVPQHLKMHCEAYDLRNNKGRWDDIMFVIKLPSSNTAPKIPGVKIPLTR